MKFEALAYKRDAYHLNFEALAYNKDAYNIMFLITLVIRIWKSQVKFSIKKL